jgi:hypothetical protein
LSITILGFVTTAVLIFAAVLAYRLYRSTQSTLLVIKAASKVAYDTAVMVQEGIKPVLGILALIKGISEGIKSFSKIFKKEESPEGDSNE